MNINRHLNNLRLNTAYFLVGEWRVSVFAMYRKRAQLPKVVVGILGTLAFVYKQLICLLNGQSGRTRRYLDDCRQHISVLFAPEVAPLAAYARSTAEARIALDTADMGTSGKVIFFSHGVFMLQNISSVLSVIAYKSDKPVLNVLLFRRQTLPDIEKWWISYARSMKINLQILHHDNLQVIETAKDLLKNNHVVLCAPDYYFSTDLSFPEAVGEYSKVVKLFVRMAKATGSDVLYVHCQNVADSQDVGRVMHKIEGYDPGDVEGFFADDLMHHAEGWSYFYDHYEALDEWRHNANETAQEQTQSE